YMRKNFCEPTGFEHNCTHFCAFLKKDRMSSAKKPAREERTFAAQMQTRGAIARRGTVLLPRLLPQALRQQARHHAPRSKRPACRKTQNGCLQRHPARR